MSVNIGTSDFTINGVFTMSYRDVPAAASAHLRNCPNTASIEQRVSSFVAGGFPQADAVNVVDAVCRWGGRIGAFISALVRNNNAAGDICTRLRAAYSAASPRDALREVIQLRWLNISFGSKLLRFLSPSARVVLDRILRDKLAYPLTSTGYSNICPDCSKVAARLTKLRLNNPLAAAYKQAGLSNPRNSNATWWAADVEMALFAEARGWSNTGTWSHPHQQPPGVIPQVRGPLQKTASAFESFWSWLELNQRASTLDGRSHVSGRVDADCLVITSSHNKSYTIMKATVAKYCTDALEARFEGQIGNRRWVAALLLTHLAEER